MLKFKPPKPRLEYDEQCATVEYLSKVYPFVIFTTAPGGMKLPMGLAMKMQRMGYRAGTPDILIFNARGGYFGLFIEMKREKGGVVSPEQKQLIPLLINAGYSCHVCKGFDAARNVVDKYMQLAVTEIKNKETLGEAICRKNPV